MKKKFYKRKRLWSVVAIIVIILFFILRPEEVITYDYVKARIGSVIQEVSVTGKVEPAIDVGLSFNKSGRVEYVGANVGDSVSRGVLLARLERGDTLAQLMGARAILDTERAKLEELKRGTRGEEINISEVKVGNARVSLQDAKLGARDVIIDANAKADDSIHNRVDQFINNPFSNFPELDFTLSNQQLESSIENGRVTIETVLTSLIRLKDVESTIEVLASARGFLTEIDSYLVDIARAVNSLDVSYSLNQTTIDSYKSAVSTARSNITNAISSVTASKDALATSQSTLRLAEENLLLLKAGTVPEQIRAQEFRVKQAEANVSNYEAELLKSTIVSPISGVVTLQDAKVGEVVTQGVVLIKVISDSKYEISVNLPEADIAKVRVGNEIKITLDAYRDGVEFKAVVSKIEPAETVIDGVSTYKTTLQFTEQDERIRSGMTANADILAATRDNVLIVPVRAIINKDSKKYVKILVDEESGEQREAEVATGLRGSDGNIEILSGISEGDLVITGEQ